LTLTAKTLNSGIFAFESRAGKGVYLFSAFSSFLEAASFSQASVLNVSEVARGCAVERKAGESYFTNMKL